MSEEATLVETATGLEWRVGVDLEVNWPMLHFDGGQAKACATTAG